MHKKKLCLFVEVFIFISLLSSSSAIAAPGGRAQTFEFTLMTRHVDSATVNFDGGARADINKDMGFGFGLGYNFDDHLAVRGLFSWHSTSYEATRVLDDGNGTTVSFGSRLDTTTMDIGVDYNFLADRLTPFISAALGWTFVDTNIPAGIPVTVCWWDPWWGYLCDTVQPTVSETEFSYRAAIGLRYDINSNIFVRASAGKYFIDYDKATSDSDNLVTQLDFGFKFD